MRVCIHTFGCQMNKLDSELMAEALAAAGHELVDEEAAAEAILFNTCAVRDHAEQRVLSRLEQLRARKRADPGLLLGVVGCFAERAAESLRERLPHIDLVCGTRRFPRIAALLEQALAGPVVETGGEEEDAPGVGGAHERTRHEGVTGYVSVMRGCDNRCAYCIVPDVRGGETSRPVEAVAAEARALVARGAKEITLLGQNIDAYGRRPGPDGRSAGDLAGLLRAVHEATAGGDPRLPRIRFVTSHPRDITPGLARTVASLPRVCRHFHMPAQSGSTRILAAMRRGYTREEYDDRLAMIRTHCPDALVASDFIVGYPGETEEDFAATLDLVRRAEFQNAFVFKYSPRPGTPAAALADDVSVEEKKRRNRALLAAQEEVARRRAAALIGSRQTILVEGVSSRDPRRLTGRTPQNLICVFPPPEGEGAALSEAILQARTGTIAELLVEEATALTLICAEA